MLGERTAEEVKMTLGSAFPLPDEPEAEIRGRDMVSGLPRTVVVSSAEVRQALEEPLHAIVDAVRATLDQTPPELAGDIMDRGIVLTGGGALLRGLDERLRHETGMPVHVAEDPLTSVALGAGKCVEEFEALQQVLVSRAEARLMSVLDRRLSAGASAAGRAATGSTSATALAGAAGRPGARLRLPDHPRLPRRRRLAGGAGPPRRRRGVRPGRGRRPPPRSGRSPPSPTGSARHDSMRDEIGELEAENAELRSRGRHHRLRPQPARGVRRPHRRRREPRLRPGPGPGGRARPVAVVLPHRHHRRRLRRRAPPRHDGPQQRRPGRPGAAGHPHHRHRAADRRRRLGGRRPGRRRAWRSASCTAAATSATTAASTSSWSTTPRSRCKHDTVVTWGSEGGAPYVSGRAGRPGHRVYSSLRETSQRAVIEPFVDFGSLDLVGVVVPVRHRERPGRHRGRREPAMSAHRGSAVAHGRCRRRRPLVLQVSLFPHLAWHGIVPNLVPARRGRRRAHPRRRSSRPCSASLAGVAARPRPARRPRRRPLGAGARPRRVRRRPGPPGRQADRRRRGRAPSPRRRSSAPRSSR